MSQPKKMHTSFWSRIDDAGSVMFGGFLLGLSNILTRLLYLIPALISSITSLLDFSFFFAIALLMATAAILFNLSFLVVNSLIIKTLILGFIVNALNTIISACFAPIDRSARERFFLGLTGLKCSAYSLYRIVRQTLCNPISILLGTHYLSLHSDEDNPQFEQRYVELQETTGNDHVLSYLNCNLYNAMQDSYAELKPKFCAIGDGLGYILSSPVFVALELAIYTAFLACAGTKLIMSCPMLIHSTSNLFTGARSIDSTESIKLRSLLEESDPGLTLSA